MKFAITTIGITILALAANLGFAGQNITVYLAEWVISIQLDILIYHHNG